MKLRLIAILAAFAAIAAWACQPQTAAEPNKAKAAKAEGPEVVMVIEGRDVTRAEYDTAVAFIKTIWDEVNANPAARAQLEKKGYGVEAYAVRQEFVGPYAVAAEFSGQLEGMKEGIDDLRTKALANPDDWAGIAKAYSDVQAPGGDLGEFTATQMVQPFSRYAFTMEPEEISEPFLTMFGYHIIQVLEKFPAVEAQAATDTTPPVPGSPARVHARHMLKMYDFGEQDPRQLFQPLMDNAEVRILAEDLIPVLGVIANPPIETEAAEASMETADAAGMRTLEIPVEGMTCEHCENTIGKVLNALDGVESVEARHADGIVKVTFDPAKVELKAIDEAIERLGYTARTEDL